MADIVSYQGNAGLGAGSNPDIAVINPNDNLKVINDTSRDVMLLDSERNMRIYNQKVKDRDSLTQLILQNQVSTKDIHEDYLPNFLNIKKDVEKAYNKWGGNPNDIKGYKEYQDTVTHLQDYAAHAQTNTAQLKKLQAERAAETLPWKQKQLDKWIDQEEGKTKKDPWAQVNPYQQLFSFSIDPINKLYKTNTTSVMSPDGLWKSDVTVGDFAGTLKNAQNEYLNNGEIAEDMREFFQQVEQYDPMQKKRFVESLNGQLQKYNQERNLQPGQPGYADPIDMVPGPDGIYRIKADPATFSAKYALGQQERYVTQGPSVFQKDLGTYKLGQEKNAIAWAKLNKVDMPKAWAYVDRWNTQKKQLTQLEQVGSQKYNDLNESVNPTDGRINTDQLPESRQFIAGIVYDPSGKQMLGRLYPKMSFYKAGKGKIEDDSDLSFKEYSKDIKDKKTKLSYPDWAKQEALQKGYTVEGHYDTKYFDPTGTEIKSPQDLSPELQKAFKNFVINYGKGFGEFKKGLSKLGKLVSQFEGSNGTATPQTILEGSRMEQAKFGKKGFEGVYGGDETGEGTGGDGSPGY